MAAGHLGGMSRTLASSRSRRSALKAAAATVAVGQFRVGRAAPATPVSSPVAGDPAARVVALAHEALASAGLNAVIVRVTIDGRDLVTEAFGESMTGVPATPEMHFRNGAVAFSYMATLLL